jgi:hypothetical protein
LIEPLVRLGVDGGQGGFVPAIGNRKHCDRRTVNQREARAQRCLDEAADQRSPDESDPRIFPLRDIRRIETHAEA